MTHDITVPVSTSSARVLTRHGSRLLYARQRALYLLRKLLHA
jgi:hypothetical protein